MIVSFVTARRSRHREIDVTPVPAWKVLARACLLAGFLALTLPLVWVAGTLAFGALLASGAAVLLWAHLRQWWTLRSLLRGDGHGATGP